MLFPGHLARVPAKTPGEPPQCGLNETIIRPAHPVKRSNPQHTEVGLATSLPDVPKCRSDGAGNLLFSSRNGGHGR